MKNIQKVTKSVLYFYVRYPLTQILMNLLQLHDLLWLRQSTEYLPPKINLKKFTQSHKTEL